MIKRKKNGRLRAKTRIRKIISGTPETIASASSLSKEIVEDLKSAKGKTAKSKLVGILVAKKALEQNISTVVFDRNGYKYHGRVQAFAEGAREGGLKF